VIEGSGDPDHITGPAGDRERCRSPMTKDIDAFERHLKSPIRRQCHRSVEDRNNYSAFRQSSMVDLDGQGLSSIGRHGTSSLAHKLRDPAHNRLQASVSANREPNKANGRNA
jgi:hypothetical protein